MFDALPKRFGKYGLTIHPEKARLVILLDAKKAGLIAAVSPLLDRLQTLGFRLDAQTRAAVLDLAGEGIAT